MVGERERIRSREQLPIAGRRLWKDGERVRGWRLCLGKLIGECESGLDSQEFLWVFLILWSRKEYDDILSV